jgi:hypothetical protein
MAAKPDLVKEARELLSAILPSKTSHDSTVGESVMNKQTRLLVGLFQQAIQVGKVESDPEKYLEKFSSEIKTTGRFFEYLGLAKADNHSPLGWKPTAPLLDLIAKSKPRRSKPTTKSSSLAESLVLDLMLETVLGKEEGNFCCYVLIRLGLIVRDVDDDWMPTPHLLRLFDVAYAVHRSAPDPDAVYEPVYTS